MESPWEGVVAGLVLSEAEYAHQLLKGKKVDEEEQTEARRMRQRVDWDEIVKAAERFRGRPWKEWAETHGDWTREGAIDVAVRFGGVRLVEVTRRIEGLKYQPAAQGMKPFGERMAQDAERQRFVKRMKRQLSII